MDGMTTITISAIIAIVGCFIGISGWLRARDAKVDREGEFKGTVNTKLDTIIADAKENARQHQELYAYHNDHETRITVLEKKRTPRRTNQDE